jgi:hypothetical protein
VRNKDGAAIELAIALAGALLARPARSEAPVSYALEYTAGKNCPDEQAFVQAIQARAPLSTRGDKSSANVVFEAHVSTESGVSRGFLLVRPAGGGVTRRDVPDASCDEIVASMAVIAALVVEGLSEASSAQPPADVPKPIESRTTPPPPATAAQPTRAPPVVAASPKRPTRRPASGRPEERPRTEADHGVRLGLAAGAGIESAIAPELVPAFAVGVDLTLRSRTVLSPNVRLSGSLRGLRSHGNGRGQRPLSLAGSAIGPVPGPVQPG